MSDLTSSLRKILESKSDPNGNDLFQHLNEVFEFLLKHPNPENYQKIEKISSFVKKVSFRYQDPMPAEDVNRLPGRWTALSEWMRDSQKLLNQPKPQINPIIAPPAYQQLPNLLHSSSLFHWAGIDFGEEQIYMLQMSLKRLLVRSEAENLRFWGKIYTTGRDYYVAEGYVKPGVQENIDRPKDYEPRGTGVNRLTYWVSHNFYEDWYELPDVTPDQLKVSRQIKKLLTGDLNAGVSSYPLFPGKERHLLRCQIARIAHSSTLVPRGVFLFDDETNEIRLEEEPQVPTFEELLTEEGWVHLLPNILTTGRITHYTPETEEDEEVDEALEQLKADDPELGRLVALTEDQPFQAYEKAWTMRIEGDDQQYAQKEADGNDCYGVNVLRSLRWPGAVTVFKGGLWENVYIGDGVKAGALPFVPTAPPDVQDEPEDPYEEYEPHPKEAPEELESDSDAEEAEEEDQQGVK